MRSELEQGSSVKFWLRHLVMPHPMSSETKRNSKWSAAVSEVKLK
jgi:hypothetical protein